MPKQGKKFTLRQTGRTRPYQLNEAVPLVQKIKYAKFDETVEVHMRLGVDPEACGPDGARYRRIFERSWKI